MNPALLNIWQSFGNALSGAATQVAASVSSQTDAVRNAAADAIAEVGAGASIGLAAQVGAPNNAYTVIQKVGANWKTWAGLGVLILVVFYFIVRKHKAK